MSSLSDDRHDDDEEVCENEELKHEATMVLHTFNVPSTHTLATMAAMEFHSAIS